MSAVLVLDFIFARLWAGYKSRVPYAATYERLVESLGGVVQNDHIAFRTLNCPQQAQPPGVEAIARVFEPLGYRRKDQYIFRDKKLTAWHWEHESNPKCPKLFISQLEVDELSVDNADRIKRAVHSTSDLLQPSDKMHLDVLAAGRAIDPVVTGALGDHLLNIFCRPWAPPLRSDIELINKESQYAAWTLLHGNEVNHFTAYINEQHVSSWPDIEATAAALAKAGVPMKSDFEGERGSKLRQTSTQAVDELCDITEANGLKSSLKWSYAYYELAERGLVPGPDGKLQRFQAFLGDQATHLFEMTRRDK